MITIQCEMHVESFSATEGPLCDPGMLEFLDDEEKAEYQNTGPLGLVAGEYTFTYDYPLSTTASFKHDLTPETTALQILALGAQDYKNIYETENADTTIAPGCIPGMLNRNSTDGRYGIWGHDLGDLAFEGINIDGQSVSFYIGS